jgi:hypothetical protein
MPRGDKDAYTDKQKMLSPLQGRDMQAWQLAA